MTKSIYPTLNLQEIQRTEGHVRSQHGGGCLQENPNPWQHTTSKDRDFFQQINYIEKKKGMKEGSIVLKRLKRHIRMDKTNVVYTLIMFVV